MDLTTVGAVIVGFFTFLVLLVPLGLSPWVPTGLAVLGLALTLLDGAVNQGRYTRLGLDLAQEWTDPSYKKRLAFHESGHLLVGYVLGLKPLAYSVGAWASFKKGYRCSSAVEFDQPEKFSPRAYGTTLMAGGVAEVLIYEEAKGGADDLEKVAVLLGQSPQRTQLTREYCRRATQILKEHNQLHRELAELMLSQAPLNQCLDKLSTVKTA